MLMNILQGFHGLGGKCKTRFNWHGIIPQTSSMSLALSLWVELEAMAEDSLLTLMSAPIGCERREGCFLKQAWQVDGATTSLPGASYSPR